MLRFLDLFSGTQSFKKALTKKYEIKEWKLINGIWKGSKDFIEEVGDIIADIEYIGIDIYSPKDENKILDLTQDNIVKKLIAIIPKGWVPNFIWASPVCNKFSKVITGKNGNFYFVLENGKIRPRRQDEIEGIQKHMLTRFKNNDIEAEALFAIKMHTNAVKIINYFNVSFALENPATAMSKYLYGNWIKNDTAYCMYGFDYKKPTAIYSNKELNLKKCNHKGMHKRVLTNTKTQRKNKTLSYAERSKVPPLLIEEILTKLTKEAKNG